VADDDGFITLPPGIADSGTYRRPRPERTVRAKQDEIVFVPTIPGLSSIAPLPPAQQPGTQQESANPLFPPPPVTPSSPPPTPEADDAGETRISVSRHAAPGWRLSIPSIAGAVTVDAPLFLGRNPTATIPAAKALGIEDPAKSLSKTHALLEVDDGVLYVSDLDSTNGVWVVPAGEDAIEVLPGQRVVVPAGADLELGDVVIQVEHG
jgi:hypothetical protein